MAPPNEPLWLPAWRALLFAQAAVVEPVERALAEAELPPLSWYDVLTALDKAPGRRLRMRELTDAVTLSRTGLVRLVDRIEEEGLLRRQPVPNDRRGAYAVLTAKGSRMLRRMWRVYRGELEKHFASHITDDDAEALLRSLGRVAALRKPRANQIATAPGR